MPLITGFKRRADLVDNVRLERLAQTLCARHCSFEHEPRSLNERDDYRLHEYLARNPVRQLGKRAQIEA